jgi:hypothetical protein
MKDPPSELSSAGGSEPVKTLYFLTHEPQAAEAGVRTFHRQMQQRS